MNLKRHDAVKKNKKFVGQRMVDTAEDRFCDAFRNQVDAFGVPGVAWHVEQDGAVVSAGGAGVRTLGSDVPVDPTGAAE
jgi:hypothetical protein